jgi:hypothetical protein
MSCKKSRCWCNVKLSSDEIDLRRCISNFGSQPHFFNSDSHHLFRYAAFFFGYPQMSFHQLCHVIVVVIVQPADLRRDSGHWRLTSHVTYCLLFSAAYSVRAEWTEPRFVTDLACSINWRALTSRLRNALNLPVSLCSCSVTSNSPRIILSEYSANTFHNSCHYTHPRCSFVETEVITYHCSLTEKENLFNIWTYWMISMSYFTLLRCLVSTVHPALRLQDYIGGDVHVS